MFNRVIQFFKDHGTKFLGFAQVTVGVFASATDLFSQAQLKTVLLANGLLVAWRGFFNSANNRNAS